MSKKLSKVGRPKGLAKTGGRKKGTRNYKSVKLRDRFNERGFDFVDEFLKNYRRIRPLKNDLGEVSPLEVRDCAKQKLEYLIKLAPSFLPRLREDSEGLPTPPPPAQSDPKAPGEVEDVPTSTLLSQLPNRPGSQH